MMEEKLIEFIRENKFLYDKKHGAYKNQILKDRKWLEFAKSVNIPVESAKKRWKTMRDRFFRVRKQNLSVPSGSGQPEMKKEYKFYKHLQFLCDVEMSNKRTIGNFETDWEVPYEFEHDSFSGESGSLMESTSSLIDEDSILDSSSSSSKITRKRRKDNAIEFEMLSMLETMKETIKEPVTPFRSFLDSIALTVEKANCSIIEESKIQLEILKVVQRELEKRVQTPI